MINGLKDIFDNAQPAGVKDKFPIASANIGTFLSALFEIIIFLAGALMFFWAVWGIFQYIFAGGDKEALGKARSRITWAVVGFLIVVLAFTISKYAETLFQQPVNPSIKTITPPTAPGT